MSVNECVLLESFSGGRQPLTFDLQKSEKLQLQLCKLPVECGAEVPLEFGHESWSWT